MVRARLGSRRARLRYCSRSRRRVSSSTVPGRAERGLRLITATTVATTMQASQIATPKLDNVSMLVEPDDAQ